MDISCCQTVGIAKSDTLNTIHQQDGASSNLIQVAKEMETGLSRRWSWQGRFRA